MSGINGDKARFHRRRKNKIARRLTQKQLYKELTAVLERSAFDTEVFIEVVDTISAITPIAARIPVTKPARLIVRATTAVNPKTRCRSDAAETLWLGRAVWVD